jgi:hypothetical protein
VSEQRFSAVLARRGTRTGIVLPFDPDAAWGAKESHHVAGTVNGRPMRGRLLVEGGVAFLPLGPAWLRDNPVAGGEEASVTLSPEGPRPGNVAEDVAAALEAEPAARAFFESLPTFYRKNFLRGIEGAKRPETRAKRVAVMMELLRAGKREP